MQEGIRRRHRRHVWRVAAGWAAATAAILLAVPPVTHVLQAGRDPAAHSAQGQSAAPAVSALAPPAAAAGTVLLGCANDVYGQLSANWRATSIEAGPLWFVYARQQGYVRITGSSARPAAVNRTGKLQVGAMVVEVGYGATVVLRVASKARSYFRFLTEFTQPPAYTLRDGVSGLTLASCPRGTPVGDNGLMTDFYLGFLIRAGGNALVHLWPSATARPVSLTFSCVKPGCGT
ncbi:MAG TPA: hypothetical protein VN840_08665 [Streptosporangiaceae bacterium]|nr:hypothetical protein [Streptosporangiaceae bacterium]